jgi:hypothetical protein
MGLSFVKPQQSGRLGSTLYKTLPEALIRGKRLANPREPALQAFIKQTLTPYQTNTYTMIIPPLTCTVSPVM